VDDYDKTALLPIGVLMAAAFVKAMVRIVNGERRPQEIFRANPVENLLGCACMVYLCVVFSLRPKCEWYLRALLVVTAVCGMAYGIRQYRNAIRERHGKHPDQMQRPRLNQTDRRSS